MIKFFLFLLFIGNSIYAQTRRIYIQHGQGYIKDTAPIISPGVGLATILSQPLLSEKQIQLLPIAIERNFRYRTEHTTVGFEQNPHHENVFLRLGITNSKLFSSPYFLALDSKFFFDNFNTDLNQIDPLQRLFVYSLISLVPEFQSRELKSGVNYEANLFEFGVRYEKDFFGFFRPTFGVDFGLGFCSIRESCTAYSINPFTGIGFFYKDIEISLNLVRRYLWLEFGGNSFNLNLKGSDTYMISISKELDLRN
jgi:hypothetical protein